MAFPVTHFEITAKDSKKLQTFYGSVFEWKLTDAPENYKMIDTKAGDHNGIGGGIGQSRDGKSLVTFYIETEDLKGTLAKVEKAGGARGGRGGGRGRRRPRVHGGQLQGRAKHVPSLQPVSY